MNNMSFFTSGGLYYQTDTTIAGFQSRVGCLFFLVGIAVIFNRNAELTYTLHLGCSYRLLVVERII
jgi:hypothetical protein